MAERGAGPGPEVLSSLPPPPPQQCLRLGPRSSVSGNVVSRPFQLVAGGSVNIAPSTKIFRWVIVLKVPLYGYLSSDGTFLGVCVCLEPYGCNSSWIHTLTEGADLCMDSRFGVFLNTWAKILLDD